MHIACNVYIVALWYAIITDVKLHSLKIHIAIVCSIAMQLWLSLWLSRVSHKYVDSPIVNGINHFFIGI